VDRWFALALLAACKGDGDGSADDTAPSETDTGGSDTEGCTNGADDDGDGLADCEDPDCVDACAEDCANGLDDDADGAIDCSDDECAGDAACSGRNPYTIVLDTYVWSTRVYVGPYIAAAYGADGVGYLRASVSVTGTPDATGTPFACDGYTWAQSGATGADYAGFEYAPGGCGGACSYAFDWQPTTASASLWWYEACPLAYFPRAALGFTWQEKTILRQGATGVWDVQYDLEDAEWYDASDYGYDYRYLYYAYYGTVRAPVSFTAMLP
jgi:hypothetical protein